MLITIANIIIVALTMLLAHEVGHVGATRLLGGQWLGVTHKGVLVGVRLAVQTLSPRQVAITLAAGPLAEILIAIVATLMAPTQEWLWGLLLGLQWIGNVVPWGIIPNDGTRLWQLWRHGSIQTW